MEKMENLFRVDDCFRITFQYPNTPSDKTCVQIFSRYFYQKPYQTKDIELIFQGYYGQWNCNIVEIVYKCRWSWNPKCNFYTKIINK